MRQESRHAVARWLTWLVLSCLIPQAALAARCAGTPDTDRPRIGLVLGGGGARGGAHIGVLKYLERHRIPVDVIAGTSMGAIIGGLYASGMSAKDIEVVLNEADWAALFSDATPRSQRTLRRKTDDDLGLYGPKLGIGANSAILPSGAVAGQKIALLMERLVSAQTRADDFDELPIPFRAISADLVTGDMVVLSSGQLSRAMRASMSVPGAFDPVRLGDRLLVDGGIVRNLPVDIARNMGADIIIAVDVSSPRLKGDELKDLLSVVNQLTTLMVVGNTEEQINSLDSHDVLLSPELGDQFSSTDFERIRDIVPFGYAASEDAALALSTLSTDVEQYQAWRQSLHACTSEPELLAFVRLENRSRFSDDVLMEKLSLRPGDRLDTETLERDIARIYGLGFIRHAQYRVVEENGSTGLVLEIEQDVRGTDFIETGLSIAGNASGSALYLKAAYLKTDLNHRGAEFRGAVQLGEDSGLISEVYWPLDDALRWNFRPSVYATRRDIGAFDQDGDAVGIVEAEEYGVELALGREFGRHAGLFTAVSRYTGDLSVRVGIPGLESYRFDGGEWSTWAIYDRLDDRYLPSRGSYAKLTYVRSMEELGADQSFEQVMFDYFSSFTRQDHTIWLATKFNHSLDDQIPLYAEFTGGGFLNMSGFLRDAFIGPNFGMSLIGYRYRLGSSGLAPAYAGTTLEYGNAAFRARDVYRQGILNGSLYLGYDSPLGPLYVGYGWSEAQSGVLFLRLGVVLGEQTIGRR
jgi:NTE family protein